jgi:hypothetical protein
MFLTTNRVRDIDDAAQSSTTIAFKYSTLSFAIRRKVWERFLKYKEQKAAGKGSLLALSFTAR